MANTAKMALRGTGIKKYFPVRSSVSNRAKRNVKAVDGVDISLHEGETYDLVGETGCSKSTLGCMLAYLTKSTGGSIEVPGQDMMAMKCHQLIEVRRKIQMVFQNPYTSLDPGQRVGGTLTEALKIHNIDTRESCVDTTVEVMEKVDLRLKYFYHYPHGFSGGQRQRVGLAGALILNPKIIVCDELVSVLGIPIQAQIISLLQDLREKEQVSFLFIAYDMSVIKYVSDRVGAMYLEYMMEEAETEGLFRNTLHPYAEALLFVVPNSSPHTEKKGIVLKGDLPSPTDLPLGCVFHTRCPYATEQCPIHTPYLEEVVLGHRVACLMYEKDWSDQT